MERVREFVVDILLGLAFWVALNCLVEFETVVHSLLAGMLVGAYTGIRAWRHGNRFAGLTRNGGSD